MTAVRSTETGDAPVAGPGRLVGIYLTPGRGSAMRSVAAALAVDGKGLDGDRYATGTGTYSGCPARAGTSR